jgi:hypothetical protein
MEPTRNNRGVSHENGTIETSHRHLKSRIEQALMVRGHRNFQSLEEYRQFLRELITRHNQRIHKEYLEELAVLRELPETKTTDFTEDRVKVTNSSTIQVKGVIYSVPSRLIGMTVKVHLYDDRLECFVGGEKVFSLERKRKNKKCVYQIDYRHLVGQLIKKPGSFKNYIYRDEMYPTLAYRLMWEKLLKEVGSRQACREYVGILKEAAQEGREAEINCYLEKKLSQNQLVRAAEVRGLFHTERELPKQEYACDSLECYNDLIGGQA